MEQYTELSLEDFRDVLSPAAVKALQVIHLAMAGGVIMFGGVVVFVNVVTQRARPASLMSAVQLLSLVHAIVAISLFSLSRRLFDSSFRRERMSKLLDTPVDKRRGGPSLPDTPAGRYFNAVKAAMIVRLAMREGAALFGLMVCLLAALDGILVTHPAYWLNLLSAFAFLLAIARDYPTVNRLEDLFREKRLYLTR